jgi:hypothetical protein
MNEVVNKSLYNKIKLRAKKKFKTWPSAYGSAWLVKEYKKQGGKYKKSKKASKKKSKKASKKKSKKASKKKSKKASKKKSKKKSKKASKKKSKRKSKKASKKKSKKKSKKATKKKSKRKSKELKGLKRWFKEEWIDVCKLPKIVKCGRNKLDKNWKKNYPYCRPYKRINSKSPKTAKEIMKSKGIKELRKRCKEKRKNPLKRMKKN